MICEIAACNWVFKAAAVGAMIALVVPPAFARSLNLLNPLELIPVPNATAKVGIFFFN
mgnify:CR=1 FL=1